MHMPQYACLQTTAVYFKISLSLSLSTLFLPYVFLFPVDEEALRKKITDELYKGLEQDRNKAEQELHAW